MSLTNEHELKSGMDGEHTDADAAMLAVIRQELDRSCAALDGHTLSRLHRMRVAAIGKRRSLMPRLLVSFGGLVTACALIVAVNIGLNARNGEVGAPAVMEDIEILSANEAPDFYADYEFYQWLAQD